MVIEDYNFVNTENSECTGDVAGERCFEIVGLSTNTLISRWQKVVDVVMYTSLLCYLVMQCLMCGVGLW